MSSLENIWTLTVEPPGAIHDMESRRMARVHYASAQIAWRAAIGYYRYLGNLFKCKWLGPGTFGHFHFRLDFVLGFDHFVKWVVFFGFYGFTDTSQCKASCEQLVMLILNIVCACGSHRCCLACRHLWLKWIDTGKSCWWQPIPRHHVTCSFLDAARTTNWNWVMRKFLWSMYLILRHQDLILGILGLRL